MTQTRTKTYVDIPCCSCGIVFFVPEEFRDARLEDGKWFYCPNGHRLSWNPEGDREAKQLRENLATAKASLIRAEERAERNYREAEHQKRVASGYKGQLVLVKKRVANGICPCCNRYFSALHEHMKNKHMDFLEESGIIAAFEEATAEGFDSAVEKACVGVSEATARQYKSVANRVKGFLFPEPA